MSITFYAHPFSSYCQKVFIALFENDTQHSLRLLDFGDKEIAEEFAGVWPIRRMPVVVDDGRSVMEATIIIEYLDLHYPGRVRFLPPDPKEALEIRFMDRFFDNYVATPMQRIVFNAMRREDEKDTQTDTDAHVLLDMAYRWLDRRIESSEWACGAAFTLADCAAAPALFYADWVHSITDEFPNVRRYRSRLLARPSFARAVDDARPYRRFFPPGAPHRD
ncbi:MAG: glutathione S-transferase [Alphaproteobacteria bacterium BRH_c36]|nr:MAG: glutathione S-transferase [Alphaproteobacteria bacterium BRH_c36]